MTIGPYLIKRLPKHHLKRVVYALWARLADRYSRVFFEEYALPEKLISELPLAPEADWNETQVNPEQARYLLWGLRCTESLPGCIVEVGSWRGVTTAYLAGNTTATVIAIDPGSTIRTRRIGGHLLTERGGSQTWLPCECRLDRPCGSGATDVFASCLLMRRTTTPMSLTTSPQLVTW
jgi:hypothetical protein